MKKLLILLFSFSILIAPSIKAETVLYCEEKISTGFIKENGLWKTTNIKDSRSTIKFNDNYSKLEGLTLKPMECTIPYSFSPERIFCVHTWGSHQVFAYNKDTKRFVFSSISAVGYIENDSEPDTDTIHAGVCKQF